MDADSVLPHVLPYGKLSPDFRLPAHNGALISREQYRGRKGLLILFFPDLALAKPLLEAMRADAAEYEMLGAVVLVISPTPPEALSQFVADQPLPSADFLLLGDLHQSAWKAYTGQAAYAYGVFVLDVYGGVDTQWIVAAPEAMPDAPKLLQWVMGAQYKCNI